MTGRARSRDRRRSTGGRGQSSVVGVALLLAMTVVTLGAVTASVGAVLDGHVARTDASRVADGFESGLRPVETTGHHRGSVRFTEGHLSTVERDLRVLDGGGVVASVDVDALVFESESRRVASVAGAVVRGQADNAWLHAPPPITASRDAGVLVVGATRLNTSDGTVSGAGITADLATNVSHDRRRFGDGEYRVAIETRTPRAFVAFFEAQGATVTYRDFDGDGVESVVASYPGRRTLYLVEHDMRLEVEHG
jgi:flagellin-like protein